MNDVKINHMATWIKVNILKAKQCMYESFWKSES